MPEGKIIPVAPGEYPQLDGIDPGTKVSFSGEATLEDTGDGQMGLRIDSIDMETEGPAEREFQKMKGGDRGGMPAPAAQGAGEDF